MKNRFKQLSINVINLIEKFPRSTVFEVIGKQLLRSSTSTGANYSSGCRARSKAEFISKLQIVLEELDETLYWLELLTEAKLIDKQKIQHLIDTVNELIAIIVTSIKTARENLKILNS